MHANNWNTKWGRTGLRMWNLIAGGILTGLCVGSAAATVVTLPPTDDAYVNDAAPNGNAGTTPWLYVGDKNWNDPIQITRTYLKFDLSSIPVGAYVSSAHIHLYVTAEGPDPAIVVGSYPVTTDAWSEFTITWNNAPTDFPSTPSDEHTITWNWDTWDVTSEVEAECSYEGDGIFSVVMKERNGEEDVDHNWLLWASKEDTDPSMHPYLEVEYGTEEPIDFAPGQQLDWLNKSAAAWGDLDGDGDLDLVLCGLLNDESPVTLVYENQGGTLAARTSTLPGVSTVARDAIALGDYDGDGDLDVALAGLSAAGPVAGVYANDGDWNFWQREDLVGVASGSVAWGDYDCDGDLDLVLTGVSEAGLISMLYKNEPLGALSPDSSTYMTGLGAGSADWADWDGDGDYDLLLTGSDGTNARVIFYENDPVGTLTDDGTHGLPGVTLADAAWGDYDHDGDLDLAYTGCTQYGGPDIARVYANNGTGVLTEIVEVLEVYRSSCAWGDYDDDGDLDVAFCGTSGSGFYTRVFEHAAGTFSEAFSSFGGACNGSASWVDVDDDGGLDLFITGGGWSGGYPTLYRRTGGTPNASPSAPTSLQAWMSPTSDGLHLSWSGAADTETPPAGLTYCLRVGSSPGADDIHSGMHATPLFGNVGQADALTLDVPPRCIYWSVRAVDSGLHPSGWAAEGFYRPDSIGYTIRTPIDDAFVVSSHPSTTFGVTMYQHLWTGHFDATGDMTRSYLKFELPELPDPEQVVCALLHLAPLTDTNDYYYVDAWFEAGDDWNETTITWNNAPTTFAASASSRQCIKGGRHCFWDVTADVAGETLGDGVITLVMRNGSPPEGIGSDLSEYWSDEAFPSEPREVCPYLEVWFIDPDWSDVPDDREEHVRFLRQNAPNPFANRTTIRYAAPSNEPLRLAVYDVSGRVVRQLVGGPHQRGLDYAITWDGRHESGRVAESGVYYYRLEGENVTETRSMILTR